VPSLRISDEHAAYIFRVESFAEQEAGKKEGTANKVLLVLLAWLILRP
jgi:hypothetical protein